MTYTLYLQLLALGIPYSGNTKLRCDPGFSLDTFYIKNVTFVTPFYHFWSTVRGKGNPKIAFLGHSVGAYSGTLRYDITLVLALLFT